MPKGIKEFQKRQHGNKGRKHSKKTRIKMSKKRKGKNNPNWKNRKIKNYAGYIYILKPKHPFSDHHNYIFEHRLVVEKYLGRYLKPKEVCHHINEIKDDNRIKNLMVFKNSGYHITFHRWGYCKPEGIIFDGRKLNNSKMVKEQK